ncbi:MAG: alginate lyase family protein [bacterium]
MTEIPGKTYFYKIKLSVYLGLLCALAGSTTRVLYFVLNESYSTSELQKVALYFVQYQLNKFGLIAFVVSLAFAGVWLLFAKLEGLALSALVAAIGMLPIFYFVNRRFLPGLHEPGSIGGNLILLLVSVSVTFAIYLRLFQDTRILHKVYSSIVFGALVLVFVGVNGFAYTKPAHSRLQPAPKKMGKDFFELFEFSSDGLSHLSPAVAERDPDATQAQFLNHFMTRSETTTEEIRERVKRLYPDSSVIIASANAVLSREFTLWDVKRKLPDKIDWYRNPTDDKIWLYALNEFEWMWDVAAAYVLTGDEKYARDFSALMQGFFEQVSLPKWKNEKDPVWRLIGAGLRMSDSWVDAFYAFLPSKSVSPELKIQLLAAIHDHAQFLSYFRSPRRNHLIQESYGLLKVGTMFPEFKMARQWRHLAVERLDREVTQDVYEDGGYTEGSIFYHRYVVRLLQTISDFAQNHDVALTANFNRQLERMYEFLLYTVRPDGRMPQVNDGFSGKVLRPLFHEPARQFSRAEFEYFATDGESGLRPSKTSVAFPYTGFYVMRSGWTKKARYCLVDAGLFGSAHGHEDKLSFELHAYGSPFIVEAGTFTYVYNQWHKYFESSFAHNTVVVDGKSQLRMPRKDEWASDPHAPLPNKWLTTPDFDYLEATYENGYGNVKERIDHRVKHTRRILFVKPDYWVLWDVLTGKGNHEYAQLFHFMPMPLEISDENKSVVSNNPEGANLLLFPLFADQVSVTRVAGSENPIQGWISPKYGEKMAAPVIIYRKKGKVPEAFLDVMLPFPDRQKIESVGVSSVPVTMKDRVVDKAKAVAVKIVTSEWTDFILLAPEVAGSKTFAGFTTSKKLFYRRMRPTGELLKEFSSDL